MLRLALAPRVGAASDRVLLTPGKGLNREKGDAAEVAVAFVKQVSAITHSDVQADAEGASALAFLSSRPLGQTCPHKFGFRCWRQMPFSGVGKRLPARLNLGGD
jgi:hypothetical protein